VEFTILAVRAKISGRLRRSQRDLRADRLARQRLTAVLDQRLFAYLRGELLFLGGSACINAVKHCVHQRRANRINGQHTRADGTARHRPDVSGSNDALRHQLSADCSEIIPPILAGAVLGPTRLRHDHAVGTAGLGDYSAALVDEGALARISADINAEIMAHRGIKGSAP